MKTRTVVLLLSVLLALPAPTLAGGVSKKDFEVKTTQNLINLLTAAPDDPLYHQAINFAHGYMLGAFHYYVSVSSGPQGIKLVCFPDPAPSRNEAIEMFIEWVKAHPQYLNERPVETEFRFLMETWPCKP